MKKSRSQIIKEYCALYGIQCIDLKLVETPLDHFRGIPFVVNTEWQLPSSEPIVKVKEKP